jgi:hypothetical protein
MPDLRYVAMIQDSPAILRRILIGSPPAGFVRQRS